MTALQANLKHLYQKRSFWLLGLFLGVFAAFITISIADGKKSSFSALCMWVFIFGVFIGTLPIDVLTKPFSYCLAGHRKIPRKFLFYIGLAISFLWSVISLLYPAPSAGRAVLVCISIFFTGTIFYWFGVWIVFRFRGWGNAMGLFPLAIFGGGLLDFHIIIEHLIVENSFLIIVLGVVVNLLSWAYWGNKNLARKYCGVMWMGAFDAWNKEKMSKFKQAKLAEKDKKKPNSMRISSGVEGFFISRISGAETGTLAQHIWGSLYKSFGVIISLGREECVQFLIMALPLLCFFGYMSGGGNIIFFIPGMMVVQLSLHVRSNLLISGGRRERFWSALTLAATTAILITFLVTFFAALTMPLKLILPELTIKGYTVAFNALNINLFFIPLFMIPVAFTIGLIFYKKPILVMIFVMMIFIFMFTSEIFRPHHNQLIQIGPIHIIIMLLSSWAVFVAVLRHICMRRCLVS